MWDRLTRTKIPCTVCVEDNQIFDDELEFIGINHHTSSISLAVWSPYLNGHVSVFTEDFYLALKNGEVMKKPVVHGPERELLVTTVFPGTWTFKKRGQITRLIKV